MKKAKSILIFAYYSYKDPVFQSAVLPYFINFPHKNEYLFYLITFEKQKFLREESEINNIRAKLITENIHWRILKWHSISLKPLKKAMDFIFSFIFLIRLIKKENIEIIYSEGFPGCIITHYISQLINIPHIVHTFEPHADYMMESGIWNKKSLEYRFIKQLEWKVGCKAKVILTATQLMVEKIKEQCRKGHAHRVPSCVETQLFKFSKIKRIEFRKKYNISANNIVLCYLGKIGGMYWDKELFEFFRCCKKKSERFIFMILSKDDPDHIYKNLCSHNINNNSFYFNLEREEIPGYLSAADFGITAIKQIPSRRYSSPIKNGEYWACGLPVIIPADISDDYLFAKEYNIGIVLNRINKSNFETAIDNIIRWTDSQDREDVVKRCVEFINNDRNVYNYKIFYHHLFQDLIF